MMSRPDGSTGDRGGISRRQFVGAVAGGVLALGRTRVTGAARFRVARINSADPYEGAALALEASGEFPNVAGRTVLIKPNLVAARLADTGVTTDPEVVRAVVDRALANGATRVAIVEGGLGGANFDECGYGPLASYDARVSLVDLSKEPVTLVSVPPGTPPPGTPGVPNAYRGIYLPSLLVEPDTVLISAPKLKTHGESMVTLSLKNLFGLPPVGPYLDPARENFRPRFSMHDRALAQTVVDIARARPIDFAIVDGVWGLEGYGPVDTSGGLPVRSNVVVAGANALAVDQVSLAVMGVPRSAVQHVEFAYLHGLGPYDPSEIDIVGDEIGIAPFARPVVPPKIWPPAVAPVPFSLSGGGAATINYRTTEAAQVRVQVLQTWDARPGQSAVRDLLPWTDLPAGDHSLSWDGRDAGGNLLPPSLYGVRVQARRQPVGNLFSACINWAVTTS